MSFIKNKKDFGFGLVSLAVSVFLLMSDGIVVGRSLFPMPSMKKRKDGSDMEYGVSIIDTLEQKVDVIMPGEVIDWTVLSYVRDAVQLGKAKAMLNIGHYNWEELGMRYYADWLPELIDNRISVTYVHSEDMYNFELKG